MYRIFTIAIAICLLAACHKWDDYTKYQEKGEPTYPGKGDTVLVSSGKGRLQIDWALSSDPSVTKYKLYWNDRNDSTEGSIPQEYIGKTLEIIVNGLSEGTYNFELYSLNDYGDRSVPYVFSGRVYGGNYEKTLLNRTVAAKDYADDILKLTWNTPDTVNMLTEIQYTNNDGETKSVYVSGDSSTISIANWKPGTKVFYKSSYKPDQTALDTFYVLYYDSLAIENILVDKSKWKIALMPTDVQTDAYGTDLSYIWDGSGGGYPNIYHSANGTMPQHFTFDMGRIYTGLTGFEETGRQDCACHNPDRFEVWGIADTTGAATTLPSNDDGWEAESISKGWILLTTVERTDDGGNPYKVDLPDGLPGVRFIRIRVLHTVDDHSSESHMSEVSFWYNP